MTKDYDKNLKPIVKVSTEKTAFGNKVYQQGDKNLTPVTSVTPEVSAFPLSGGRPKNADSNRLQKASKFAGKVSDNGPVAF